MRPNHRPRGAALILVLPAALILAILPAARSQTTARDLSKLPIDRLIREIETSYRGARALKANFVQTYSAGDGDRTESGQVILARGGLMRWDYQQPARKVFLLDGKNLELYLPAANQLEKSPVKASEDYRIPFRLLLSRLDLKRYFSEIESVSGDSGQLPGDRVLIGVPKGGKDRPFDQVLMEFEPDLNIRRLVITYRDGSKMRFIFSKIQRNPPVGASTFRLTPPSGTEIIDESKQGGG